MKANSLLVALVLLSSTLPAGAATMTVSSNPGQNVTVKFSFGAANLGPASGSFTFVTAKGLIGSTSNPSDQSGFKNSAGNLFAITTIPATKSAFVYLFLANAKRDFQLLTGVNRQVAKFLPQPWRDDAREFLRVETIHGRKVKLETIDYAHAPFKTHTFWVKVDAFGGITYL